MTPIADRLSALAAQMREDARQAGIHATKARPAVEQAAADVEAARKLLAEAEKAHREALAVVARHELDGQEAADMAAKLDRLAAEHRTAPELPVHVKPIEVPVDERPPACRSCGEPIVPDGTGHWLHVDASAARDHFPKPLDDDADMPFNVVPASPQTVAAVEQATGELVAVHGPGVTSPMPDAPHRHARPKERPGPLARITRRTGPHRVIASPDATRPDTDVPDELLAEGQRQARPDDPNGEK